VNPDPFPPARPRAGAVSEPLLVAPDATVTCPSCQAEFSLGQGFASRSFEQLRQASLARLEALRRAAADLEAQRADALNAASARQVEELKRALAERDGAHARQLEETRLLEQRATLAQLEGLRQSLATRDQRIGELMERGRLLDEKAHALGLQEHEFAQRVARAAHEEAQRLELARSGIERQAREAESERWRLREAEYQKKLEDTVKRLEEAQRSAAQGSQQLQGEVLEIVLEDQLRGAFPLDSIEEVKKGARGGDVIHRVMTRSGQQAGVILWEAKRAQNWSREWAVKLKGDLRALGAEVGVIVTLVMPKECPADAPFDLYEDIWVTTPGAVLALAKVLASALGDVHKQRLVSANKGEKMEAVYDYVTSAQFGHKIRAIATTLKRLREELESERTQTLQRWSRREKQIQQAVIELAGVGGDLQGLVQHDLPQLEIEPNIPSLTETLPLSRRTAALLASAALLAAVAMPIAAARIPAYIATAVADPARPPADQARDVARKPAECLAFAGIKPGMKVAEIIPSSGYFTRLFSAVVGPKGEVFALQPPPRPQAEGAAAPPPPAVEAIAADPHYSNVQVLVQPLATPSVPEPVDLFWTSQNYHDLHNVPGIDIGAFNRAVFKALKPGGIYVVLDHAAEAGSGSRDTSTLHRIDPAVVKREVLEAGFRFDGASKVLANPDDPHTAKVFDPAIRGKTDQFIYRFRKPR
jgi:predicted methyltransferase